ncbi:hypothetical protein BH20ACT6_BH20ACT6_08360 [soil metagenome]
MQVAEQEVDVEAALVRLVDDDGVIAPQQWVALDLGDQDAVGHQLDQAVVADLVGETDRIADDAAQLGGHLLGQPLSDAARGDPPRLRVPDVAAPSVPQLEQHLRQLGGLARPGLTGEHDHLVVTQRGQDVVMGLADRQLGRVVQPRLGPSAPLCPGLGRLHLGGDLLENGRASARVLGAPYALELAADPVRVGERQVVEAGPQRDLLVGGRTHRPARIRLGFPPLAATRPGAARHVYVARIPLTRRTCLVKRWSATFTWRAEGE